MKLTHLASAATLAIIAGSAASASECGELTMAEMNWASAELMANVDKIILEEGYGCDVELIPGATTTTFASMNEKGEPDVAGELWINAVRDLLVPAMEEGRLHSLVEGPITGLGEGWWVTEKFAADHPDLNTVEKVLEHPELFPYAEDASKGAFMGCPAGWGCQLSNANLFHAFDMENKGWTLVDPGSAAGLDGAIAKAAERDEPWFGYYWAPTSVLGSYPMVMVETAPYNEVTHTCNLTEDCATPGLSAYPTADVLTIATSDFVEREPDAAELMRNLSFTNDQMNEVLAWQDSNSASYEEAAVYYLTNYKDVWSEWLNAEARGKLAALLK